MKDCGKQQLELKDEMLTGMERRGKMCRGCRMSGERAVRALVHVRCDVPQHSTAC